MIEKPKHVSKSVTYIKKSQKERFLELKPILNQSLDLVSSYPTETFNENKKIFEKLNTFLRNSSNGLLDIKNELNKLLDQPIELNRPNDSLDVQSFDKQLVDGNEKVIDHQTSLNDSFETLELNEIKNFDIIKDPIEIINGNDEGYFINEDHLVPFGINNLEILESGNNADLEIMGNKDFKDLNGYFLVEDVKSKGRPVKTKKSDLFYWGKNKKLDKVPKSLTPLKVDLKVASDQEKYINSSIVDDFLRI